jgi:hypothetical protein
MIWFGWMSDISQLASKVGGEGEWGNKLPISLHYLAQAEGKVWGVAFPLLGSYLVELDLT